jgi:hypothetical protein
MDWMARRYGVEDSLEESMEKRPVSREELKGLGRKATARLNDELIELSSQHGDVHLQDLTSVCRNALCL